MTPKTSVRLTSPRALAAYAAAGAVIVLTVSLTAGAGPYASLSIQDPGTVVRLGAPLLRLVVDAAATVTTGALVFAAFFTRGSKPGGTTPGGTTPAATAPGLISPTAYAALRTAGRAALVWALAALVLWPFDTAATAGLPLHRILDPRGLAVATWTLPGPKAWLITFGLAAGLAVAAPRTLRRRTTPALAAVAVLALLPVITAGHSASDTGHDLATAAIAVHIPAAVVWLGTLIALVRARGLGADRPAALRRYARLSAGCWFLVAFSGVVDAVVLAPGGSLLTTGFGALLLVKVGVMGLLVGVRRKLLTAEPAPRRLLGIELAALAAAFGLSVGLTDLAAPKFLIDAVTGQQSLLGYDLTAPPTLLRLLVDWRFEPLFGPLCAALAAAYLIGVRRSGRAWPTGRTVAWLAGCAVLLFATSSGLGRYAPAMFSLEAVDHMLVGMVAPALLALGAPLTLAGVALRPSDLPGPREWLVRAGGMRALTRPVPVTLLFVGAPFLLYFTDAYDLSVRFHWAHLGMDLLFLVIGYLFAWTMIGADPAPEPAPSLIRLGLLLVAMPFDVVLAAAIAGSGHLIGDGPASANLYHALDLPWVPSLAADQRLGAYLALAVSEVTMFALLVVVMIQWRPAAPDPDYEALVEQALATSRPAGNP